MMKFNVSDYEQLFNKVSYQHKKQLLNKVIEWSSKDHKVGMYNLVHTQ